MPTLEELERENAELRKNVQILERQVEFLTAHRTLASGISGERLVSEMVNGTMTSYAASFDVLDMSGRRVEVKYSRLNVATKGGPTKRWSWNKIFGEGGAKAFDYLVLVGERDERWLDLYKDRDSPFVFFCVPLSEVAGFTIIMGGGRHRAIQLTSNPRKAGSRASGLFDKYQQTADELKTMFGL